MKPKIPGNLTNEVGHLIRRCHQITQAFYADDVREVTPVQGLVIKLILDQPGIAQRELASIAGIDEVTLGGVVKRLTERDLVKRIVNPADRRARQLTLTPAGLRLWDEIRPKLHRPTARLVQPLAPEEVETLVALLRKLVMSHS